MRCAACAWYARRSRVPLRLPRLAVVCKLAQGARAALSPMAALLGGFVGQEVVKAASGKFHPLFQARCCHCCCGRARRALPCCRRLAEGPVGVAIKGQHVHRGARLIVKPTPPYTLCPQWFYFDSLESMPDSPLAPEDMAPQACAARTWRVAQEGGPRTAWRAVLTAVLLLLPSLCAAAGQPLRRSSGGVWAGGAAAAGSAQDLSGKALGGQLSMMRAWRSLPRPAAPHPHTTPRRAQVGAGALGCEFLKNVALMGVSCGEACPPRASVCARA